MANKYELRRRALRDAQGRSDNPFASPRSGERTQPRDYTPPPPMDRRRLTLVLSLGLAALIVALYVQTGLRGITLPRSQRPMSVQKDFHEPIVGHDFTVCDDNVYIYEKPQIVSGLTWEHVVWAFADAHEGNWHPLTWISHMLDWQLFSQGSWEPDNHRYKYSWPGGHHLVSMGIHCINAVLLFLALRMLTGTLWPSFVVAALFGVHPLRVESVAWAAERKDVLCGLFWMAAMLAYAGYARRRPLRQSSPPEVAGTIAIYVLVSLFLALGLMAKSMIVTLPCVFILLDIWPLGRWKRALWSRGRRDLDPDLFAVGGLLLEKIPWFLMVLGDSLVTFYGQEKGVALNSWAGLPLSHRLWNAVVSYGEYLRQTVWPTGLAPFYTHPAMIPNGWTRDFYIRFYVYSGLLTAITLLAIWFFRKRPFLAIGWFWYLGTLIPVIGIWQVGTQARADRYTYLPMIGVYLMVAWLLKEIADRWPETRVALAVSSVVVLAALSAVTFRQVSYWADSYKLFGHAAQVTDKNYFAYNHIGIVYDSDAKKMAGLDAEEAAALFSHVSQYFPGPPQKLDEARKRQWSLDVPDEDFTAAALKLDRFQKQQLLFDYSADAFQATIDIKPDYDFGNNNLGVYYARRGGPEDLQLAEKFFSGALMSNQRYADAYNNLGIILARQGAELAGKGKFPEALKKFDDSIACHKRGLGVRIDRASDHNNLCRVYMQKHDVHVKLGDLESAKDDFDNALKENTFSLQCDPNFLGAWFSREEIFVKQKNLDEGAKCVQRMIEIDAKSPETIPALLMFVGNCIDQNRPDDALALLNQFLSVNPAPPEIYNARGYAYRQKGDLNHARQDFEHVLSLVPQFPGAQQALKAIKEQMANPRK